MFSVACVGAIYLAPVFRWEGATMKGLAEEIAPSSYLQSNIYSVGIFLPNRWLEARQQTNTSNQMRNGHRH